VSAEKPVVHFFFCSLTVPTASTITTLPVPSRRAKWSFKTSQGQRTLNRCSGNDFEQELFVPTTTAAFHDKARTVWMLLQE
jgi:hypothetical protein